MSSAEVVCCESLPSITDELSIEANSADPEQTAPIGAVRSGSTLFVRFLKHFSRREKQTTFVAIGALRVKWTFLMYLLNRSLVPRRGCHIGESPILSDDPLQMDNL